MAKATAERETKVTLVLSEAEAKCLARVLLHQTDWLQDEDGHLSEEIYNSLDAEGFDGTDRTNKGP